MRRLLLGGPGAGKTERLLRIVEETLDRGVPPNHIAFCSFTNSASDEGRVRAIRKFNFSEDDLPYFRTLHSLCFRQLGWRKDQVMQKNHYEQLAELSREDIIPLEVDLELADGNPLFNIEASPYLTIDHYARTTCQALTEAYRLNSRELEWDRLEAFAECYRLFKQDLGIFDFTDMLSQFVHEGQAVPVEVVLIDEAQDLTMLQWQVIERAFGGCEEMYIAGDDDQSVHKWAGAAEDHLLGLDYPREVLEVCHRLPAPVFDLGQKIIHQVEHRFAKVQRAGDSRGEIRWHVEPDWTPLRDEGTWLLMARTRRQLSTWRELAIKHGVYASYLGQPLLAKTYVRAIQAYETWRRGEPIRGSDAVTVLRLLEKRVPANIAEEGLYGSADFGVEPKAIWHDALTGMPIGKRTYALACLRNGEKLTIRPRVEITTLHGGKGKEADNVAFLSDLTRQTEESFFLDPEPEHRLFYVAVTRARRNLHIIGPQGNRGYPYFLIDPTR